MRNKYKYLFAALSFVGLSFTSCSEEATIVPADVENLRAESHPGYIILRWDTPEESSIRQIKVKYYDDRLKMDVQRSASAYSDSILIPDKR